MQSLEALSLSPGVKQWLTNARPARVLHVFGRACNLINEDGELLSIVTPEIGDGPLNLVIRESACFPDFLRAQSPVSVSADGLALGSICIRTTAARLWSPQPSWGQLYRNRRAIASRLSGISVLELLKRSGFALSGLPGRRGLFISESVLSDFCLALAGADIFTARRLAARLAGFGVGLTPAGDDFLLGSIYAAQIIHPPERARLLVRAVAGTAAPLTTSLSAAWLRAGARGEAARIWHDLFGALLVGDQTMIQSGTFKLLSVGHTSGADSLLGFARLIACWSNARAEGGVPFNAAGAGL